jgi:hypothetical protein
VLGLDRHGGAAEVADAIVRVLTEPGLADRMSAAALDFVAGRGLQRAADDLLNVVLGAEAGAISRAG